MSTETSITDSLKSQTADLFAWIRDIEKRLSGCEVMIADIRKSIDGFSDYEKRLTENEAGLESIGGAASRIEGGLSSLREEVQEVRKQIADDFREDSRRRERGKKSKPMSLREIILTAVASLGLAMGGGSTIGVASLAGGDSQQPPQQSLSPQYYYPPPQVPAQAPVLHSDPSMKGDRSD